MAGVAEVAGAMCVIMLDECGKGLGGLGGELEIVGREVVVGDGEQLRGVEVVEVVEIGLGDA